MHEVLKLPDLRSLYSCEHVCEVLVSWTGQARAFSSEFSVSPLECMESLEYELWVEVVMVTIIKLVDFLFK